MAAKAALPRLLAFCTMMAPAHLHAAECYQVVNVDMWDVLYIRSARSHLSRAVGAIAPDHSGIVQASGPCRPAGVGRKRQWCRIDYFPLPNVKISGFVKAHFVAPAGCPEPLRRAP